MQSLNDYTRFFTASYLRFLDKLFSAPGAGDGDFSLASGDPDHLVALGAVKIPVLPVPDPFKEMQEFPVFLVAFIGIAGQAAHDGPGHQTVAEQNQHHAQCVKGADHRQKAGSQTRAENCHIQSVRAVAASHKAALRL